MATAILAKNREMVVIHAAIQIHIRPIHGKENPADALKRLQVGEVAKEFLRQTEDCALTVVTDAIPAALLPRQVERESELDPTLQLVHEVLTTGDCSPKAQQGKNMKHAG